MAGGDVLEVMAFVQNQPAVRGQHRRLLPVVLGLPHRQVRRQQVMVDHDHVRLGRPSPGAEQEAPVEVGALEPGAQVRLGADLVPDLRARRHRQVAQRAVGGVSGPLGDAEQLVELVLLQQRPLGADRLVQAGEAEVVPPPLEQGERRRVLRRPPAPGEAAAGPSPPAAPAG